MADHQTINRRDHGALLPELPAVVWGQHVAPFLSRRDQISLMRTCRDINEQRIELHWPSIRLRVPGLLRFCFSPCSQFLVVAQADDFDDGTFPSCTSTLRVWNVKTGKIRKPLLTWKLQRFNYIQGMTFSSCQTKLVVWSTQDATIRIYNVIYDENTFRLHPTYQELVPPFDTSVVETVSFASDNRRLVVSYSRMEVVPPNYRDHFRIAVWDLSTFSGGECAQHSDEAMFGKQFIACDDDLDILTTSQEDPTKFRLWKTEKERLAVVDTMSEDEEANCRDTFSTLDHPLSDSLTTWSMVKSPADPTIFAALSYTPSENDYVQARICIIRLCGGNDLKLLNTFPWRFLRHTPKLEWFPDGKHLIGLGDDKTVECFHLNDRRASNKRSVDTLVYRANLIDLEHEQQDVKFSLARNRNVMAVQKGFNSLHLVSF